MRISLKNKDSESVSGFYKYDFGQVLEIEGLELPEQFEVHFQNGTGTPVTVNGTYNSESGIATVPIPDECFQQEALVFDAWLWVEDERSGKTLKTITFYLIDRECPEGVPPISSVNEIKGYADFVRENAQKVAEAEQAANDVEEFLNTADLKISEATNSKLDKQQGIENAGRILKVGSDGNIGLGDVYIKTGRKSLDLSGTTRREPYNINQIENVAIYDVVESGYICNDYNTNSGFYIEKGSIIGYFDEFFTAFTEAGLMYISLTNNTDSVWYKDAYVPSFEDVDIEITNMVLENVQTSSTGSVALRNLYAYYLEEMQSLNISVTSFFEVTNKAYLVFQSGTTPTTLTYPADTIIFVGDDCADSDFTPLANAGYEVVFKHLGEFNGKARILAKVTKF